MAEKAEPMEEEDDRIENEDEAEVDADVVAGDDGADVGLTTRLLLMIGASLSDRMIAIVMLRHGVLRDCVNVNAAFHVASYRLIDSQQQFRQLAHVRALALVAQQMAHSIERQWAEEQDYSRRRLDKPIQLAYHK